MEAFGIKREVMDERLHRLLHLATPWRHNLAVEASNRTFRHLLEALLHDLRRLAHFFNANHEAIITVAIRAAGDFKRSEEHTSELQSLMRNSYAVFSLKINKSQPTPA